MIPILYQSTETQFRSNGIGRLSEAITCKITEERNGSFELEMTYPVSGKLFGSIVPSAYIKANNTNKLAAQVFCIYKVSKPINGIITVYAEHISYQLSHIPVKPFSATSASSVMAGLESNAVEDCPFTFWTDKTTSANFATNTPASIRSLLGGSSGSVLDVFGGEYEFDNYTVKLHNNRGADNGVVLRYGKNITDIRQEENIASTITGVYPYWVGSDDAYVETSDRIVYSDNAGNFPYKRTIPLDCSSEFESTPTEAQLIAYAEEYLANNSAGEPKVSITVSFVALWQTEEYKDIAPLEKVNLCDTVTIDFVKLGILAKAKIVKTVYNVLLDRYDSLEIGEPKSNLASNMISQAEDVANQMGDIESQIPSKSFIENAAANATNWITGADGGYVVMHKDANGMPYEILIMDNADIDQAVNVWRFNKNGLGYSSTGYNGTYALAMTIDGTIVADFITAGTMLANRIKGGTLSLGGASNGDGVCVVYDADSDEIVRLDEDGAHIFGGEIELSASSFTLLGSVFVGMYVKDMSSPDHMYFVSPINIHGYNSSGLRTFTVTNDSGGSVRVWDEGGADGSTYRSSMSPSLIYTKGNLTVAGTKSRVVETPSYNERLAYCYEMASPVFGDIGTGKVGADGYCYVYIDPVLLETISTSCEYQVFLQKEGAGDLYVAEKNGDHFVVAGTTDLAFSWELKVKQRDYELIRLETMEMELESDTDYTAMWAVEVANYEAEVTSYGS